MFGYDGEASNEWLWSVQYDAVISSNKTKEAYYMAPRTLGGCAYFGPTQTFVDMFQCKDITASYCTDQSHSLLASPS